MTWWRLLVLVIWVDAVVLGQGPWFGAMWAKSVSMSKEVNRPSSNGLHAQAFAMVYNGKGFCCSSVCDARHGSLPTLLGMHSCQCCLDLEWTPCGTGRGSSRYCCAEMGELSPLVPREVLGFPTCWVSAWTWKHLTCQTYMDSQTCTIRQACREFCTYIIMITPPPPLPTTTTTTTVKEKLWLQRRNYEDMQVITWEWALEPVWGIQDSAVDANSAQVPSRLFILYP